MEWQFRNDSPIYTQLTQRLTQAIVAGEFRPGERLPSVRELAVEAGVNPNTVQRALADLERDGLVFSQRTAGRFVTDDAERIGQERRALASGKIHRFLDEMGNLGFEKKEILELLEEEGK